MSDYADEGERGKIPIIIPKARKAIHSITGHSDKMSCNKNTPEKHLSADEVDNIFSKPESPIENRKLQTGRDVDVETTDNHSESLKEEILSSFPSRESVGINNSNTLESTNNKESYTDIVYLPHLYNNETRRASASSQYSENLNVVKRNCTGYVIAALGVVVSLLFAVIYKPTAITSSNYDKFSFNNDIQSLGLQYKIKDDSLLQVQSGINTIFEKQDTGSFIFTYDSNIHNFDPRRFNKFMDNIAGAASRFLRNNTKDVQHVVLDNYKIISLKTDYELIEKFRNNVDNRGVLLVKNVEQVPSKLAMAFHYYCDEFNPLVKKSAIFFTLDVAECSSSQSQKATHAYIEKCLKAKWKDVEGDKIGPLLNRVVNIVIDVKTV